MTFPLSCEITCAVKKALILGTSMLINDYHLFLVWFYMYLRVLEWQNGKTPTLFIFFFQYNLLKLIEILLVIYKSNDDNWKKREKRLRRECSGEKRWWKEQIIMTRWPRLKMKYPVMETIDLYFTFSNDLCHILPLWGCQ